MKLKQCPFLFFAGIKSDLTEKPVSYPSFSWKETRINYPVGLTCIGEKCQMWNEKTEDCGLKRSKKDDHKQEEKQPLTPEERDQIHLPFLKDPSKLTQDPWTCPE